MISPDKAFYSGGKILKSQFFIEADRGNDEILVEVGFKYAERQTGRYEKSKFSIGISMYVHYKTINLQFTFRVQ